MCMSKPKAAPPPQPPAPAPAPPQAAADVLDSETTKEESVVQKAQRNGRKALRIDKTNQGLNIPVGN